MAKGKKKVVNKNIDKSHFLRYHKIVYLPRFTYMVYSYQISPYIVICPRYIIVPSAKVAEN